MNINTFDACAGGLGQSQESHDRIVDLLERFGHEIQGIVNNRRVEEVDTRDEAPVDTRIHSKSK